MEVAHKRPRSGSVESTSAEPLRKVQKGEEVFNSHDIETRPALAQLVDFSALVSEVTIARQSQLLAEALLWDYTLLLLHQSGREEYEILEIEFYLKKTGHDDPFAHGTQEQSASGNWCVT